MKFLSLSCIRPEENLAVDEALIEEAEAAGRPCEVLRLWEPAAPVVIVGRSSLVGREIHEETCRRRGIPILRRTSGGAAIVTGPGCLMYALVLSYQLRPEMHSLDAAHSLVMETMAAALSTLVPGVVRSGICDVTCDDRKVSGNSVRCRRQHLLYHGTVMYDFDLELIDACLAMPPRQPDYRAQRAHRDFVANLPASRQQLFDALRQAWEAHNACSPPAAELIEGLIARKYSQHDWNYKY